MGRSAEHGQIVGAVADGQGFTLWHPQRFQQRQQPARLGAALEYVFREMVAAPIDDLKVGGHGLAEALLGRFRPGEADEFHEIRVLLPGINPKALLPHPVQLFADERQLPAVRLIHDGAVIPLVKGQDIEFSDCFGHVGAEGRIRFFPVEPVVPQPNLHAAAADVAPEGHGLDPGVDMGIGPAGVDHRHMPIFRQPCHGTNGGRGDFLGFLVNDGSVYVKKYDHGDSLFRGIA